MGVSSAETSSHERPPSPTTTSDSPGSGCVVGGTGTVVRLTYASVSAATITRSRTTSVLTGWRRITGDRLQTETVHGGRGHGLESEGPGRPARLPLPIVDAPTLTTLAIAAVAVALLALALAVAAQPGACPGSVATSPPSVTTARPTSRAWPPPRTTASTGSRPSLTRLREHVASAEDDVRQSLRNVAVVRYDAFGDMGGRLSFSAAIVDDLGDGIVIEPIHARGESRTYAKGIVGGKSSITLTPEEQQALASATRLPDRTKDAS